ncbi:hypothetical protein ACFWB0_02910 [Rhodococcus sp. NPDC060086]|uniref:hypothetical protein n=1 Tax=Rhodococcus sp. NPDC060086 TaxID=3347055 RepID=UPI0036654DBD
MSENTAPATIDFAAEIAARYAEMEVKYGPCFDDEDPNATEWIEVSDAVRIRTNDCLVEADILGTELTLDAEGAHTLVDGLQVALQRLRAAEVIPALVLGPDAG